MAEHEKPRYPHEDGWWHQALCADLPPDAMFPPHHDRGAVAYAKEICRRCPVRVPCAEDAPDDGYGVWAGSGTNVHRLRRSVGK